MQLARPRLISYSCSFEATLTELSLARVGDGHFVPARLQDLIDLLTYLG